jgi:hypothetical protein
VVALVAVVILPGAVAAFGAAQTPPDQCEERDEESDHGPPEECTEVDGPGDTVNGVDAVTFWKLWSGDADDADQPDFETERADERTDLERYRGFSTVTDFSFHAPPTAVGTWNAADFEEFSGGDRRVSVHPSGATLRKDVEPATSETGVLAIRDAYVAVFSVGPSTLVHQGGSVDRLVAPSGTVRVVNDFRVVKPEGYTPPSPDIGDERYRYVDFSYSREVTFSVDGTPQRTVDADAPSFSFGEFTPGESKQFGVTVEVTAAVTEETKSYVCKEWDNGSCVAEGWEDDWDDDGTLEVDVTQTQTESGTVYGPPSASARAFEHAESTEGGVAVTFEDAWASVELGDTEIRSGWQFFTRSPDGWGEMTRRTAADSEPGPSVRPLEVHAYTVNDTDVNTTTPDLDATAQMRQSRTEGEVTEGTSDLPVNTDLDAVEDHLSVRTYVATSRDLSQIDVEDGSVVGLVAGQTSSVSVSGPETVRTVTVSVESRSENDDTYTYEIGVTDGSGDPVDAGEVVLNGQRASVDDGTATVTVENRGYALDIGYEPPEWTGEGPYYEPTDTIVPLGSTGVPSPMEVFGFVLMMFIWCIPFALVLVALDYVFGTRFLRDSLPSTFDALRGLRDALFGGRP